MERQYLVLADRGCYSDYSMLWYVCEGEEKVRELIALAKEVDRIIRQKRFVAPPWKKVYESPAANAQSYLTYDHIDVRYVREVVGKKLYGDQDDGGVDHLIEDYRGHIARASDGR